MLTKFLNTWVGLAFLGIAGIFAWFLTQLAIGLVVYLVIALSAT